MVEKVGGMKPILKKDGGAKLPISCRIFSEAPSAPQKTIDGAPRRYDWGEGAKPNFAATPESGVWEGAMASLALSPHVCPRP